MGSAGKVGCVTVTEGENLVSDTGRTKAYHTSQLSLQKQQGRRGKENIHHPAIAPQHLSMEIEPKIFFYFMPEQTVLKTTTGVKQDGVKILDL